MTRQTRQTLTEADLTARLYVMPDDDLLALWDEASEYAEATDSEDAWSAVARIEQVVTARGLA